MAKIFISLAAILGTLSVSIGAFGAHALKKLLENSGRVEVFEKGVKYQFYHSLALLLLGILILIKGESKLLTWSGWSFVTGIIIFSGSLYILCLSNTPKWGMVTPIGGTLFLAGWMLLLLAAIKF